MVKPINPAMRQRLLAAHDSAADLLQVGYLPEAVIRDLVTGHDAHFGYVRGTYRLRCATVEITNTSGAPRAMLSTWMRRAAARLETTPSAQQACSAGRTAPVSAKCAAGATQMRGVIWSRSALEDIKRTAS